METIIHTRIELHITIQMESRKQRCIHTFHQHKVVETEAGVGGQKTHQFHTLVRLHYLEHFGFDWTNAYWECEGTDTFEGTWNSSLDQLLPFLHSWSKRVNKMDLRNNNDDKVTSTIKKQKHLDYIKFCEFLAFVTIATLCSNIDKERM